MFHLRICFLLYIFFHLSPTSLILRAQLEDPFFPSHSRGALQSAMKRGAVVTGRHVAIQGFFFPVTWRRRRIKLRCGSVCACVVLFFCFQHCFLLLWCLYWWCWQRQEWCDVVECSAVKLFTIREGHIASRDSGVPLATKKTKTVSEWTLSIYIFFSVFLIRPGARLVTCGVSAWPVVWAWIWLLTASSLS